MKFEVRSFYLYWSHQGKLRLPTLRDAEGKCVQPYTDYFDSLAAIYDKSTEQAARSGIAAITYSLLALAIFLHSRSYKLEDVCDKVLEEFAEWELEKVKANPKSRGNEYKAKETVNTKLRCIYHFFNWTQKYFYLEAQTIGPTGCRITSTIPSIDSERNPSNYILSTKRKYPILFSLTGRSSDPGMGQHWASDEDIENLEDLFWRCPTLIAMRNSLMLLILDVHGWRISSANSLRCSQFSDAAIKKHATDIGLPVTPPSQKFGAQRPFDMPRHVVDRIREYINDKITGREAIVEAARARDIKVDTDNLFLSLRGTAMKPNTWSSIFGDAFKEIGAPKGAAVHAVRRGSGQRHAEQTIECLIEAGMPVTEEAVIAELKEFLGHSTAQAQAAYFRVRRRRFGRTRVDRLAKALEERTSAVNQLKADLANANTELERERKEKEALQQALQTLQKIHARNIKRFSSASKLATKAC